MQLGYNQGQHPRFRVKANHLGFYVYDGVEDRMIHEPMLSYARAIELRNKVRREYLKKCQSGNRS